MREECLVSSTSSSFTRIKIKTRRTQRLLLNNTNKWQEQKLTKVYTRQSTLKYCLNTIPVPDVNVAADKRHLTLQCSS